MFKQEKKENIKDVFLPSQMQKTLINSAILGHNPEIYIEQSHFKVKGDFKLALFEKAWNILIDRHDCLRSAFLWQESTDIQQIVLSECKFKINIKYIGTYSSIEQENIINNFKQHDAKKGFDFKVPPLMRITVFIVGRDTFDIIFTFHHVIIDSWSIQVLTKEFTEIYRSLSQGHLLTLPAPVRYKTYIEWYQKLDFNRAHLYWDKKIASLKQITRIPLTMAPEKKHYENTFGKKIVFIEDKTSEDIVKFCANNSITENAFVSAGWSILLHLLCSVDQVSFGSVVSQRPHSLVGSHEIVGPLINSIPIIIDINEDIEIQSFFKYVQHELVINYRYSCLPINEIAEKIATVKNNKKVDQKLFDTIVSIEKYIEINRQYKENLVGIDLEFYEQSSRVDFPIVLKCDLYKIELTYLSHYLAESYAGNIVCLFLKLMKIIISNPELTIREIINALSVNFPILKGDTIDNQLNLNQMIHLNAQLYPDKNAISDENCRYTYSELSEKIKNIANRLPMQKGEIIGVYQERSIDSFLSMLAIMECGGCYLPLDVSYPEDRLKYIVKDSQLAKIITHKKAEKIFDGIHYILIDELNQNDYMTKTSDTILEIEGTDLAYIIYTSGSTGTPKGAINTYNGIKSLLTACKQIIGNKLQFAQAMQFASISFDVSILELALSAVSCSCLHVIPEAKRQDLTQLVDYLNSKKIQLAFLPPIVIAHLNKHELNELTMLFTGGDVCPANFAIDWVSDPSKLFFNLYGPTETSVIATYNPVHKNKNGFALGYPLPNTEIKIIDNNGRVLPAGVVGELVIIGTGVGDGYYNNPTLTAKAFKYGGYCTGDLAYYDCNNMLYFIGRNDEQIQIRGFRVELGEIETIISKRFNFQEVVIIAERLLNNTKLHLFILSSDSHKIEFKELKHHLRKILPGYMIPDELHTLEYWPITPNKKIDRHKLKESYCRFNQQTPASLVGIHSDFDNIIINEVAKALNISAETISITDDFFDIGGNSLTLTSLVLRLNKKFNIELPFQTVYDNSHINELAKCISQLINNSVVSQPVNDSDLDIILDYPISVNGLLPVKNSRQPRKILLTGGTGFVGIYFIKELIENSSADIYCLVRGKNTYEAKNKLHNKLAQYNLLAENNFSRIKIILGDFSKINLGLNAQFYEKLAKEIDIVFHCGAKVNLVDSYSRMSCANVNGTLNIVKFATHIKLKPIHHISTASVFIGMVGLIDVAYEDTTIPENTLPENGYIRSKWAAEKIMENARKQGVPVNIYRLPRVWGDTTTGRLNPHDALFLMLAAAIEIKKFPLCPDAFLSDIIPVDYCVKVIHKISQKIDSVGRNYHILYPQNISINDLVDLIRKKGVILNRVPVAEWFTTLTNYASDINCSMAIKSAASFSIGFSHNILKMKITKLDNTHVYKEINQDEINLNNNVIENYITFLVDYIKS